MATSQFEAKTFGVGQLISQRKSFAVPVHQRSYAWTKDAVQEFLNDVESSLAKGDSDYFLGLIVIQAAGGGQWVLLDGQQRLTTVSLIYAALRKWLFDKGFDEDAKQIDHEFIGVRKLGGEYSSRMVLNDENRSVYSMVAQGESSSSELHKAKQNSGRSTSNAFLLDAALVCREWVSSLAGSSSEDESAAVDRIYALAGFLDLRLKVVAVEVTDDVDAYVLFESLNDRGIALSALDLIKNYILGKDPGQDARWRELISFLGDRNHDDFLKVFWTSRRGLISKSQIFKSVKSTYTSQGDVSALLDELTIDARLLAALSDEDDPFWEQYSSEVRALVSILLTMDSKQVRALLVALLREIADQRVVADCIWLLSVAIVRFQVIGKGRTGVVEKVIGRICERVSDGAITTSPQFLEEISELITPDADFFDAFKRHTDKKFVRVASLLSVDLIADLGGQVARIDIVDARGVMSAARLSVPADFPEGMSHLSASIGNSTLVFDEPQLAAMARTHGPRIMDHDVESYVLRRAEFLADRAVRIWSPEAAL
ncbi:DUF262 domain-containing protein [Stenotrophomonas maltophilia]|uniref:DUF262 domain-containing protein n=1 Tax=Stenotrophomonas maltophilia TaxID=40324 RepID=UPI003BA2B3F6